MNKKPVNGMRDVLPKEMELRTYVLSVIRGTYRAYGFTEMETPVVESIENLQGRQGGCPFYPWHYQAVSFLYCGAGRPRCARDCPSKNRVLSSGRCLADVQAFGCLPECISHRRVRRKRYLPEKSHDFHSGGNGRSHPEKGALWHACRFRHHSQTGGGKTAWIS